MQPTGAERLRRRAVKCADTLPHHGPFCRRRDAKVARDECGLIYLMIRFSTHSVVTYFVDDKMTLALFCRIRLMVVSHLQGELLGGADVAPVGEADRWFQMIKYFDKSHK